MKKIRTFLRKVFSVPHITFPKVNLPLRKIGHKVATVILWTPRKIGWALRKIMYGIVVSILWPSRKIRQLRGQLFVLL